MYSKSQPLRINTKARSNAATLIKSKRIEVARINLMQAQVEENVLTFNLEYRNPALLRGIPHGLLTKSQCSINAKNSSEMSETQWSYTLHISLNLEKSDGSVF
jgi:hypothetical protein